MGCCLLVVFDKQVPDAQGDEYRALGNGLTRLDKALEKAGLPTLGVLVSADPSEWMDMDEDDPYAEGLPAEQWFHPADGLATVRQAITLLRDKPKTMPHADAALRELECVERELVAAEQKQAKFHFQFAD